jgi:proline dehydrogenase
MKLVRRLHGKKEIVRCRRKGYPSLCASKEATDENYDAAVHYMIDNLDLMSILQEPTMS